MENELSLPSDAIENIIFLAEIFSGNIFSIKNREINFSDLWNTLFSFPHNFGHVRTVVVCLLFQ